MSEARTTLATVKIMDAMLEMLEIGFSETEIETAVFAATHIIILCRQQSGSIEALEDIKAAASKIAHRSEAEMAAQMEAQK